ncbi:tetratricopeptide repeat-containing sensor histidine kinase [Mucilaginibacter ginsenosidivorans]|uniref:histidine kinase n=1 Tax=Mucilaginibacter ginsenosidivorans TaxID=398053 RepID=A0A5B8V0X1_9SPHI|nr:tetratricopeptide repeat protein [Mucilaginibacter ginsenosidivorans]QEC65157.1 tetratricopeptide repeat protein [Mucilaginibacter ginsenosidivorans]
MKRYLTLFILLLTALSGFARGPYDGSYAGSSAYGMASYRVDSLKTLLAASLANKDTPIDTLTINRINKLAAEFIDINPDSTIYYSKLAIVRSIAIKYNSGIADGMVELGKVYSLKGDYTKAEKNFKGAELLYIKIKDDAGLANCYIHTGRLYNRMSNFNTASYYFNKSLEINRRISNEAGIADSYHNIGMVADNIGKSSYALDNYFKSLSINIKLHDKFSSASNYNNIGEIMKGMEIYPKSMEYYKRALLIWQNSKNIQGMSTGYQNIAEILMLQKKFDEALPYIRRSLKLTIDQDDKDGLAGLYRDLGLCYANKKDFATSLAYMAKSLKIATDYKLDYDKTVSLSSFASVYNLQKDYKNAYQYATIAREASQKLGNISLRANAALQLSSALAGLERFQEAFEMRKQYDDLKDSLKSEENVQKLTSFNLESTFQEKQRRIAEEHQRKDEQYQEKIQRQGLLSVIFFIIILGMIAVLIVYYKAKRKQQKINTILEDKNHEVLKQQADLNNQTYKLNESNNLKDRLISVLAHDLRAPLSTLRGLFGLLEDESITHEQFLSMIPQALKKLEYTSDFLDTLLFWINSQMENFNSSTKSFTLKEIAAFEVQNYQEQAAEKGIKLLDSVPESMAVTADPNSIRIVIRNLITNAIKFSRKDDTIQVTAHRHEDNFILLSVKDTGVGMSEKQLNKLFRSKVDSGTGTNNESGTGMGLLFCKDLIEKCNGKIWVESVQGSGTEFFFTLPMTMSIVKEEEEVAMAS